MRWRTVEPTWRLLFFLCKVAIEWNDLDLGFELNLLASTRLGCFLFDHRHLLRLVMLAGPVEVTIVFVEETVVVALTDRDR